ncbi:MAG: WD40 repeat domain-containing protein, partial [Actinobacteria bacterium]|nr:WD40 repeat domain-containing protein [Actinomycetota bacterium]
MSDVTAAPTSPALWTAAVDDHVVGLGWSPSGATVAAASIGGPILLASAERGETVADLSGHGLGTTSIAWRPGAGELASGGQDGCVRLWGESGELLWEVELGSAWVEALSWTTDGKRLAIAAGRKVCVLDPAGREQHVSTEHPSTVLDLGWRPGARDLELGAATYGGVRMWRPARGETRTLTWKGSVLRVAWSPDGAWLATGDQDATVHLWRIERGEDMMMSGFETKVVELTWDATSRYLATGGGDSVAVWDCSGKGPAGRTPAMLLPEAGKVTTLAFAPEDTRLAV